MLALPSQTPGLIEQIGLGQAEVNHAVWALDSAGRLYVAGGAINRVLAELPGWRWAALLAWLPPIFWPEQRVYYWFGANRYRFARFGVEPACSRPGVRCTPRAD